MTHRGFCRVCDMETNQITFKQVSPTGVYYVQSNCKRCGSCLGSENIHGIATKQAVGKCLKLLKNKIRVNNKWHLTKKQLKRIKVKSMKQVVIVNIAKW